MAPLNLVDRAGLKFTTGTRPTGCAVACMMYGDVGLTIEICPTCPEYLKYLELNKKCKDNRGNR